MKLENITPKIAIRATRNVISHVKFVIRENKIESEKQVDTCVA